ncbi:MAG: shikimate kinase [bacterium]|nr:shikimate kinase [bacterium]
MRIYLIGFMAAGKTKVGISLSGLLGYRFCDLDQEIEGQVGASVREIFERRGEDSFRDLEHGCLERTASFENAVIATGGGTMTFERNRALIRDSGVSVWLDPSFEILLERLARGARGSRPLFRDEEQARSLYDSRLDAYRMADLRIETMAEDTPGGVAGKIAARLRERSCAI